MIDYVDLIYNSGRVSLKCYDGIDSFQLCNVSTAEALIFIKNILATTLPNSDLTESVEELPN